MHGRDVVDFEYNYSSLDGLHLQNISSRTEREFTCTVLVEVRSIPPVSMVKDWNSYLLHKDLTKYSKLIANLKYKLKRTLHCASMRSFYCVDYIIGHTTCTYSIDMGWYGIDRPSHHR